MQPLQAVHALPLQASSCLSVLPSLCASMPTDAVQVGPLGSPFNTGLKQQFALANVGGQLQQLRVLTPIQTIQNTVVPSSQAAVFASTGGAQLLQAGARLQPPKEHRTIFFAGCTPVVSSETVFSLFSQFGLVEDVNLFRPYSGSKTSKGCGLVVFACRAAAASALDALNGRFQWPGARTPMVCEWLDPLKQHKKARAQPLSFPPMQHAHISQGLQAGFLTDRMLPLQLGNQLYMNTTPLYC